MFWALTCPSSRGKIVFNTASGIFTLELSERSYINIIPPEDGHVNAQNMSRILM
jgi:hypothetical protein